MIVSAKHGQSPIDRTLRVAVDDAPYDAFPGAGFHIADDEALIWLRPQIRAADLAGAKAYLLANAAKLHIETMLDRNRWPRFTRIRNMTPGRQTSSRSRRTA